ncbi:MAG: signal peptidase I [Clostridiales bacterium]|nr:signal peptidase I [Clostridiales bacterium]
MGSETRKEIISWIVVITAAVLSALFINGYIIVHANVPTGSMLDTIPLESRVVGLKLTYLFSEPQRYDVVVFPFPDHEEELFVKRIIGLPGETITIADGKVYVNDDPEPLRDDFIREPSRYTGGPFVVPEGHYFMMGDNRNDSRDSREWVNKYVSREKIIGKLYFSYYPQIKWIE